MNKHHIYDDNDVEIHRPAVYQDAYRGWVREFAVSPDRYLVQNVLTGRVY